MIDVDVPRLLDRLGVHAKKRSRQITAPCPYPYHHADGTPDRNPSWAIRSEPGDPRNGRHFCMTCGRGGDVADLVVLFLACTRSEAWKWLASGEVLRDRVFPSQIVVSIGRRDRQFFELPSGVTFAPFEEWPTPARLYLGRRGVTEEQVMRWGMGFAVDGRLAMRIVIPVRDASGRPVSFVARAFTARYAGREAKRYLEPREEDDALKGAILGEHLWPAHEHRKLVLVGEGAFDGLALERVTATEDRSSVAVLHGSPVPGQGGWDALIGKLATFEEAAVAVDPNDAGERLYASLAGALKRYVRVWPIRTPKTDVAGFAEREGDLALASFIARSRPAFPVAA